MINAHELFVLANRYTLAGFMFPGGSDHINLEFRMWAYEGRVYRLSLDPGRRHIYPVCEESGALVTQLIYVTYFKIGTYSMLILL